jgi:hypothetical protein
MFKNKSSLEGALQKAMRKRGTTLGTVSDLCITTDLLKRSTDNENSSSIDISTGFTRMKGWFRLSVFIHPFIPIDRFSDAQIAQFCTSR